MSSSSPPSSDPTAVFSVRIVSLDYYLSPPIPDLDFCYSDFQGRKVEEVPIIRIYGSTPAGQKACLHVHRALPYLYIPYPDDLLHNPEEGHAYLRILSRAIEKALSHKSTASKKQHVHGCSLVRAKTIYGYHSSEELYIKIYLYYPHEVARAASLLLGGSILDRTFQPYESHIPYLLQFLVDHNLYGMSHIHTSKYKFRPPIPDGFISKKACYKKDDLADSSSEAVGNPAIWLSSTVPSALIWSDSSTGHDDLDDKNTQLIRRQGICGLELDSSIDDILNVKYKLYTSLSQTGSDVKVVQSLIPIWEEEYERSGMQETVKSPDSSKPQPEDVLKSFLHGLEYENALSELCLVAQKYFPSKSSAIEDDEKLNKYVKSFTDIAKGLMEHQRLSSSCGERLKCPEEYKQVCLSPGLPSEENIHSRPCEKICEFHELASVSKMSLSETIGTEEPKQGLDNEALGLLSWLASSQAVDDLSFDDELVHEAVLSPLLPTKSYKKALEMAHLDYETASQQECQDILDSVEVLKSEGLKEQVSFTGGHENMDSASSGNVIPQVDGSFDDNFKTPQKEEFSEINLNSGRERPSVHLVGKCTSKRFDCEKNKIIWGPLPISIKQKEHGDFEPTSVNPTDIEMGNVSESNYSTGSKDRGNDTSKVDAGAETSSEKLGKMSACSVRDLMRRKRYFRTEQSESERHNLLCDGQKDEMVAYCPVKPMHHSIEIERPYVMPVEPPHSNSLIDYDGVVQESMTCALCTQVVCTEGYCLGPTDKCLQPNIILNEHLGFHRGPSDGEYKDMSTGFQNFAVTGPPVAQSESINLCKLCKIGHLDNATGCHNNKMSDASWSCLRSATCEISRCKEELSAGYKPRVCEMENVGNIDGCLKSNFCGDHFVDGCLKDGRVVQEKLPERHFDGLPESSSALDASNLLIKNRLSAEFDMGTSSSNPKCRICSDSQKQKNPLDYIEMTLSRKPPSRDEVGRISEDSPGISGRVGISDICDDSLAIGRPFIHSDGQGFNDYLPYFVKNSEDGQPSNSSLNAENLNSYRESALGVPSHFQNDGSVLYLLSHAFSPPTLDCVQQWLLEEVQQNCLNGAAGVYKERIPSSPSSSDPSPEYNNGLGATGCYRSPDSSRAPGLKPKKLPNQENSKSANAEYNFHIDTVSSEPQLADVHVKEYVVANNWQDLSQISGPDEKSNLTPLSQIGFRDPASVGGGQQLTLISMEILAESREDLRPDPQFDSINIISLAIQEDTSHNFEVYVLMRGNSEELYGRNVDGISDCKFVIAPEEKHLLEYCVKLISSFDPDILMGWEIQGDSLGFLAERAAHLGIGLLKQISRVPQYEAKCRFRDQGNLKSHNVDNEPSITDTVLEDAIIEDEWGRTHASGVHVAGRIVLNVWRLMRSEVKLNMYTVEAVAEEVLRRKIPSISCKVLNHWYSSGPERARYRCIEYVIERAKLNIQIMNQLDLINRTSELARIFGIDFFSVLSRGSQFRVESMLLRLAHTQNYLAISPGRQQVASQPAMECLPLVMEPESGFYVDPVVVLDFQSLYPSMIIAYNLCFSTCLGKVVPSKANVLGVSSYSPDPKLFEDLKQQILLTPNGVMYVPSKVRKGVLPRLLEEILSTRIMIKQAMKKLMPTQQVLQRIFNARQLALKLIANVTYGYTAAGFSGRMPCAELADSIVQCGRRTLETAISFVNEHNKWKARVIYGDTDSMFVLLKGRTVEEAFRIGNEIASSITAMNPNPVTLKMEKVYLPCFLLTKKRYVGYSYECPDQNKPTFDAKGIETVRRDTCPAVAKTLEQSIRLMFEHRDIYRVKSYLQRQWTRILSGKVSLQDFVFAKEVRLGTYSACASSLPPATIVATKAMRLDPRAEPRYGERVPYVVIHGEPGSRLTDMVVDPLDLLDINSPYRLNDFYYINKQIIPALQRVFGLLGVDLYQWFSEMPRPVRPTLAKRHSSVSHSGSLHEYDDKRLGISKKAQAKRRRIDTYYVSKHCTVCGELVQASSYLCDKCSKMQPLVATTVVGRTSRLEREIQHLAAICRHCGGGDWIIESGVKCTSLACSVFYERRKVQKELQAVSSFATETGFYPSCMTEWF